MQISLAGLNNYNGL